MSRSGDVAHFDNGYLTSSVVPHAVRLKILRDGLFTHSETFEIDDLDTALARFDELTGTPTT